MGKLHKIRKAFEALSDEDKRKDWGGVWYREGKIGFNTIHWSYQRYVGKLRREYLEGVAQGD